MWNVNHDDEMPAWLRAAGPAMLATLRSWVEVETPSQEPDRVRQLAGLVAAEFEKEDCRPTLHPHALELRRAGRAGSRKPLLVMGHLDTVYAAGTLARMPWRVAEGRVYGPGVYDMKGGIVSALYALRALREIGTRATTSPLDFLFVFDEEVGSKGSRPLTETRAREAAAALVLEPGAEPGAALKLERKGIALYKVRAHGVAAHAGVDFERGDNAILKLARAALETAAWSDVPQGITVNCGVIRGGTRSNVVPDEAEAEIEARAWRRADLESVDARLRGLDLEVEGGINRPPMEATNASRALAHKAQLWAAELGVRLTIARTGGGSDGNFAAACGCPTLDGLGVAGDGAHTPGEHLRLADLAPRTALLARLFVGL